ncbi:dienelactone hydrolase family protein [Actinomadura sp. WMMB 499]|uniref:dienelactone hydrolase family protein n=1 Tax=Actinomadura sp. WMMB 499 TaxID=1219491 RepID=UPI001244A956|nr:dienelactone hydrolase family protein [Actinomadura sp. WMMB 499]QFG21311.1 dienelactone hydrolase family protein [Actinomadura sp. WMMB 499]
MSASHDPIPSTVSSGTSVLRLLTRDGPMQVYTARPKAPARGAVIVIQEAFGVNDHIRDVTRRLAGRGHLALAPDMFHRSGVGTLGYDRREQAMAEIGALGPDEINTDVGAVLEHVRTAEGIDRVSVMGFCFGGRAAFTAATAHPGLAGTVVFYGPGIAAGPHAVIDRAVSITAPMLLHVGDRDPTIPAEQIGTIDGALTAAGVDFEQHVYPGAGHAFACDARPQMYSHLNAGTAWKRTYTFLDEHMS